MVYLHKTLAAWNTEQFEAALKSEVEQLKVEQLPLQQALSHSSIALDSPVKAVILGAEQHNDTIRVKAGLFYEGLVAGCSCADDPTPVEAVPEYCEVLLEIDLQTASTTVTLLDS